MLIIKNNLISKKQTDNQSLKMRLKKTKAQKK
jgi:hypothetical protein